MEKMTEDFIAECKRLGIPEEAYKADVDYLRKIAKLGVSLDIKRQAKSLYDLLHLQIAN